MQTEMSSSEKAWESQGLQSLALMAWAITLSSLRMAPQLVPKEITLENPDVVMEEAIQKGVFSYLHKSYLNNDVIYKDEFMLRRIHSLITDFISQLPHKVKEMRLRADDTDKTIHAYMHEGLEPPTNLSHHFEDMLLVIAKLYEKDPLGVELELDFWCSSDSVHLASFPYRAQPKKEALYSFLLQTCEVLPSTLFVPYLKMLSSLSSCQRAAMQCFNLLKNNENKNLTWDHFFNSFNRYFNNLRQEALPTPDTVYRARSFNKGITPHEQLALQAVLDLIRTVAENDPCSGEQFCMNQQWSAITVLLGLVTCSVPIPLKANLLNTLAAFSKSPKTAASLWHNIEASQIISTVPSTSNFQPRGIQTELEEVECRNEEYPLTRAVLKLFNGLSDKPIPKLLGVSQRTPGYDPYLNFILNSVLLKFVGRCYKNPKEKWEVCEDAMSLICKLLLQYDPAKDEFLSKHVQAYTIGNAQVNPLPGYHIMISLCSKSELLRLLLLLIDEGCRVFDAFESIPGKTEFENSVLYALKMLEHGLAIQNQFLNLLHAENSNILLVGLNRLILGVNEVTCKPDHLLNISKYVTYQSWLPQHALPAVNILLSVTSYPAPQGHLLSLYLTSPNTKASIRHGFVSCLEAEEELVDTGMSMELDREDVYADEDDLRKIVTKTKKAICQFLLQTLTQGAPNVAHYLFGFDLNTEIKKSILKQPGLYGTPRSCLHSVICLLNSHLVNPYQSSGHLIELYYKIIYALAYNTRTSEPTLRFLRSSGNFLKRHLSALPFTTERIDISTEIQLHQMSWLLKTVAIEMKVTALNQQYSQLTSMIEAFTGNSKGDLDDDSQQMGQSLLSSTRIDKKAGEQLVLRLIKYMRFSVDTVPVPQFEYLDFNHVMKLVKTCEVEDGKMKVIDVRAVHHLLEQELAIVHEKRRIGLVTHNSSPQPPNETLLQRNHRKEMERVLNYVVQLNASILMNQATVRFLDAWRHATEVMFAVAAPINEKEQHALNLEKRFNLLVDIIHELLTKAVQSGSQAEVANLVSGSILLLCVDLRQTYISEMGKGDETDSKLCNFMDSNHYKLTTIITNLVKWILSSGVTSQKLRANLYSALLNFLHLNRDKSALRQGAKVGLRGNDSQYVTMLDKSIGGDRADIDIILAHGERLVDMLCHDCSTGHDICKMLALSCLDMVVELDAQTTWTSVLSSRGYLKYIIDSLLDMDKYLIALLSNNIKSLRALYVYESKMALLCRVASSRIGAEILLEQNVLPCLSSLHVFNKHPDIMANVPKIGVTMMEVDFVPNVSSRYLQILSPALQLCDAIISSMGVENQLAIMQVLKFLLCHGEMVTQVLRSGSPFHPLCYLKELSLLTGVIARATNEDVLRILSEEGMDPGGVLESTSLFNRVQRLMLSLISRFIISESLLKELVKEAETSSDSPKSKSEVVITFLEIVSHLLIYARNIVSSGSMDRRISTVIFQPALIDNAMPDKRDLLTMQEATLGVVVQQLVQAESHHRREKSNLDLLVRKLQSVPEMNTATLKQHLPESYANLNEVEECRRQVTRIVTRELDDKKRELDLCFFIIEHCMYIVWTHLDYYMLRGISNKVLGTTKQTNKSFNQTMHFDVTWNVTTDDLNHLKQGLLSVFNDTFTNSLRSTVQDMHAKDKGFLEALLRRIKKLIQFAPN
ncbi:nuclear pore complex protein Nup205-like [Cimex lectularius]|uniref:Nuclear pore complex protein Nup205 n=1 Tax=Cimex lectularius TaxID=79782 RepID=A0A8I6SSM8_CIMLE|nr:nuclear pore complex protein Nup205-like [Cimex lectularius]